MELIKLKLLTLFLYLPIITLTFSITLLFLSILEKEKEEAKELLSRGVIMFSALSVIVLMFSYPNPELYKEHSTLLNFYLLVSVMFLLYFIPLFISSFPFAEKKKEEEEKNEK